MGGSSIIVLPNGHADGLLSVTNVTPTEALVSFNQTITNFSNTSAQFWNVYDPNASLTFAIGSAFGYTNAVSTSPQIYSAQAQSSQTVKVWFNPPLLPLADYTLVCDITHQGWIGGVLSSVYSGITSYIYTSASYTFTNPNTAVALGAEWRHGLFKAISRSTGQLLQEFSGQPETILIADIKPTDIHIFVESTLGFPNSGYIFIGNIEYEYTSKTDSSFRNVTPNNRPEYTQPARHSVLLNQRRIIPNKSMPYLTASKSGDGTDGIL